MRCNCLAALELKNGDKKGRFRTKCRFGFSKALLSTTQPPHQKIGLREYEVDAVLVKQLAISVAAVCDRRSNFENERDCRNKCDAHRAPLQY